MDICPGIPDGSQFQLLLEKRGYKNEWGKYAIAIPDKTRSNYYIISDDWAHCNPYGFADWFKSRMKVRYDERRKILAEQMLKGRVEDVPEFRVKTPLQQVVQLLKHHRNIKFINDKDVKPASIIITTLAAMAYNNEADLTDALFNVLRSMRNFIKSVYNTSTGQFEDVVTNPVNPLENFADRWVESPAKRENFYKWLDTVEIDFNNARSGGDFEKIAETLEGGFGAGIMNEALKKSFDSMSISAGSSTALSRYNVPHRQRPEWPLKLKNKVSVKGFGVWDKVRRKEITNGGTPLAKNVSLGFYAQTDVMEPYTVKWQVVNTGAEASARNNLRGGFYESDYSNKLKRSESTLYKGFHWIECFIISNGECVARSGEFVVKIM